MSSWVAQLVCPKTLFILFPSSEKHQLEINKIYLVWDRKPRQQIIYASILTAIHIFYEVLRCFGG